MGMMFDRFDRFDSFKEESSTSLLGMLLEMLGILRKSLLFPH